jgi:hypothetical protein
MSKKKITYGVMRDEHIIVQSLSDELRFVKCMKLYKAFETMEKLEGALTEEALIKINQIY